MSDEVAMISPPKLGFSLSSSEQATCDMTITAKERVAYKVKTTQPTRYLVQPNQGVLDAGEEKGVKIILVDKDRNSLLEKMSADGTIDCTDKFLVQLAPLSDEKFKQFSASPKEDQAQELSNLWGTKPPTKNRKLTVELTRSAAPAAVSKARDSLSGGQDSSTMVASESAAVGGRTQGNRGPADDYEALKKKYEELLKYLESVADDREQLKERLKQAERDLQREMTAKLALEGKSLRYGDSAGDMGREIKKGSSGVSLLYVIIMAVIFFLGGWSLKG